VNIVEWTDLDELRNEVKARIQRFARLRSTHRVLAPSVMRLQADGDFTLGRTIREALSRLSKQTDELDELSDGDQFLFSSALENVDRELEEAAEHLLGCADEVGPAQLRSTLPRIMEQHAGEVLALLELMIEHREGIETRLPTVEYLITLLSTSERGGRRSIGRDPVTLSPMLEQLAIDLMSEGAPDTSGFELELFQASALESGDESMADVAVRMRGMKLELHRHVQHAYVQPDP